MALLAAVSALCALCDLRSAAQHDAGRADVGRMEALLRACSDVLAARRALTLQHGAWLKACLTKLASLLQALKAAPPGDSTATFPLHCLASSAPDGHFGVTSTQAGPSQMWTCA